jgi:hypothetical protein
VELLWWEGCPSTPRAAQELREVLAELGLGDVDVQMREMRTDAEAHDARFVGSPTVMIDGEDAVPPDENPVGLSCRIYHRRDGRISPTPDPDDLRDALRRALGSRAD